MSNPLALDGDDELIRALSAELLATKRKLYDKIIVTEVATGAEDSPEKIFYDAGREDSQGKIDAYKERRATFDTVPLDPEGNTVRLYPKQWTIFSGYTGTGKTTYLRQMVCGLLKAGKMVFVANLEADPEDFIIELANTAAGTELVTAAQLDKFLELYGEKLKLWGRIGVADHKKILATVRALREIGLDYAILDSLMMLDVEEDDIEEQRKFAALLTASAITTGIHIILVAHPRKPMDPDAAPSVHNVSGSSKLTNLAFNVMFIRRGPPIPGNDKVTSMQLHILKQRTMGSIGMIEGFYSRERNQFSLDSMAASPTFYLPADCYPASGLTEDLPEHVMNPNAFRVDPYTTDPKPAWEL